MSLFIGFINKNAVYVAADSRVSMDIPYIGRKWYDFMQKLGFIDKEGKFCGADAGITNASERIFDELIRRSILSIDALADTTNEIFKRNHMAILNYYNLTYQGNNDLRNCITLLFSGIDKNNKPKMCVIDSALDYNKQWFDKNGDFVFNRIDNGEIDLYLNKSLKELCSKITERDNLEYILEELKQIFIYVSKNDIGVSPLTFFVKISPQGTIYKDFFLLKRFFHQMRFYFDNLIYLRILKLHKRRKQ